MYFHIMNFFTATINSWQNLLNKDEVKDIVLNSMKWLVQNGKTHIHGFVIMPNHIHVLWTEVLVGEGANKEVGIGSKKKRQTSRQVLLSFTGHQFKEYLLKTNPKELMKYVSTQNDRQYHFWQRNSKSIDMLTRKIAEQKLDYIHHNPVQPKWKLVEDFVDYRYSSASFYELNQTEFNFLSHYMDFI